MICYLASIQTPIGVLWPLRRITYCWPLSAVVASARPTPCGFAYLATVVCSTRAALCAWSLAQSVFQTLIVRKRGTGSDGCQTTATRVSFVRSCTREFFLSLFVLGFVASEGFGRTNKILPARPNLGHPFLQHPARGEAPSNVPHLPPILGSRMREMGAAISDSAKRADCAIFPATPVPCSPKPRSS